MKSTRAASPRRGHEHSPSENEPRPWRTADDTKGWTTVYRGSRKGKPPLISLQVDLDRARSDWLRAESEWTGLDYIALTEHLIDAARTLRSE